MLLLPAYRECKVPLYSSKPSAQLPWVQLFNMATGDNSMAKKDNCRDALKSCLNIELFARLAQMQPAARAVFNEEVQRFKHVNIRVCFDPAAALYPCVPTLSCGSPLPRSMSCSM